MPKAPTPKLDQLRAMREARYNRKPVTAPKPTTKNLKSTMPRKGGRRGS